MLIAITRAVSSRIGQCELTHLAREPIDHRRASTQHAAYQACLGRAGCHVTTLPGDDELPDSVFIEDTAVVLDELALITRPGAASRRPETTPVLEALRPYRQVASIEPPGTLDGGDVLRVGRTLYVGLSARTSAEGVTQLSRLAEPFGYQVRPTPIAGCLHLKSAVTEIGDGELAINPAWVDRRFFAEFNLVEIDPSEPFGANLLRIGARVIGSAAFPRTLQRLASRGVQVVPVDVSELGKAEGGVTCCSLVFAQMT
jgi:dimethylargininase